MFEHVLIKLLFFKACFGPGLARVWPGFHSSPPPLLSVLGSNPGNFLENGHFHALAPKVPHLSAQCTPKKVIRFGWLVLQRTPSAKGKLPHLTRCTHFWTEVSDPQGCAPICVLPEIGSLSNGQVETAPPPSLTHTTHSPRVEEVQFSCFLPPPFTSLARFCP